jgi:transposase
MDTRFLEDGRIEIDNNTVERTMRPIGLGRKNHIFAGSPDGGGTWSILASLLNTARLNEIDPQEYLTDVLERIVSGRTKINRLRELLPREWRRSRQQACRPRPEPQGPWFIAAAVLLAPPGRRSCRRKHPHG